MKAAPVSPPPAFPAGQFRPWMGEGLNDDPAGPASDQESRCAARPARYSNAPSRSQQLAVISEFADGSVRDVTRLTVFSSSDPAIAQVNANGLVEFSQSGEVAILCRFLEELVPVRLMYLEPKAGFKWSNPPETNYVDKHTFAKLKMLNIQPSDVCSDQEFIRRAYLDVCGVVPSPQEVTKFLESKDPNKRAKLTDELLDRPEYADFWTLKWSDVFRSTRKTIQIKGTHVFQKWLRNHIDKNDGFDQIVYEVITSGGSTFANPAANYYRVSRDPTSLAETTAQLFFGIRMQAHEVPQPPVRTAPGRRTTSLQHGRLLPSRVDIAAIRSTTIRRRKTAPNTFMSNAAAKSSSRARKKPWRRNSWAAKFPRSPSARTAANRWASGCPLRKIRLCQSRS